MCLFCEYHVVLTPALRSSCHVSWIDMSFKVSYNCWTLTISCKIDFDFTEIETTIFQFVLPSDRHVVRIHHLKVVQQCQQRSHWQCSLTWCEHDTVLSPRAVEVPVSPQVTKLSHDMLPALLFGWYRTGCCDRWLAMRTCMLDILYVWLPCGLPASTCSIQHNMPIMNNSTVLNTTLTCSLHYCHWLNHFKFVLVQLHHKPVVTLI